MWYDRRILTSIVWFCILSSSVPCFSISINLDSDQNRIGRLLDLVQDISKENDRLRITPGSSHEDYQRNQDRETSLTLALTAVGDPAIDPLVERIKIAKKSENQAFLRRVPFILSEIGSSKADNTLLDMALGRNTFKNFGVDEAASVRYVNMMVDRRDRKACRVFLVNDQGLNYGYALHAIEGIELDRELLTKVIELLGKRAHIEDAVQVLAADPSISFVEEKVQALVKSIEAIPGIPGKLPFGGEMRPLTEEDSLYCAHVRALGQLKGADEPLRQCLEKTTDTRVRHCLMIALALRGDLASARESLQSFLKDPEYRTLVGMRSLCVKECFSKYGEKQDLPFLKEFSETDLYNQERDTRFASIYWHRWGNEYINLKEREARDPYFIETHQENLAQAGADVVKIIYPIREAAKKAIEAIEAREKGQAGKEETK